MAYSPHKLDYLPRYPEVKRREAAFIDVQDRLYYRTDDFPELAADLREKKQEALIVLLPIAAKPLEFPDVREPILVIRIQDRKLVLFEFSSIRASDATALLIF